MYEFHSEGFFGYGAEGNFKYFTPAYFIPIILVILSGVLFRVFRTKLQKFTNSVWEKRLRFFVAFIIIVASCGYYWRISYVGTGKANTYDLLVSSLPFEVCEWTVFASSFMLMMKSEKLFNIAYYITFSCNFISILTPVVLSNTGPAYFRYYQYYAVHALPIVATLYMMNAYNYRPKLKMFWEPFAFLFAIAIPATYINSKVKGANYMFLATKTEMDSLANIMPQSIPLRLTIYLAIILVLFSLLYLPYLIKDIKQKNSH